MSTCPVCLGAGQFVQPDETAVECSLCLGAGEFDGLCVICRHGRDDHGPTGCLVDWLGPQDPDGCPCDARG